MFTFSLLTSWTWSLCWIPSNIPVLRQGWSRTLVPCVTWGLSNVTNWRGTVSLTQVRRPLPRALIALIVLPLTSVMLHALLIIGYMAASNSNLGRFLSLRCQMLMFHASAGSFINICICTLCMKWHDDWTKRPTSLLGLLLYSPFSPLKWSTLGFIAHLTRLYLTPPLFSFFILGVWR